MDVKVFEWWLVLHSIWEAADAAACAWPVLGRSKLQNGHIPTVVL